MLFNDGLIATVISLGFVLVCLESRLGQMPAEWNSVVNLLEDILFLNLKHNEPLRRRRNSLT